MTQPATPAPKKRLPRWAAYTIAAVVAVCAIGVLANLDDDDETPQVQPGQTSAPAAAAATEAPDPEPAPAPVSVTGSGNTLADIGATLNGRFRLEYTAGSWCIIVDFLKPDGTDAGGWDSGVSECSGDPDTNATGSRIVELDDAAMVQVDNTRGPWSLTFTPLG